MKPKYLTPLGAPVEPINNRRIVLGAIVLASITAILAAGVAGIVGVQRKRLERAFEKLTDDSYKHGYELYEGPCSDEMFLACQYENYDYPACSEYYFGKRKYAVFGDFEQDYNSCFLDPYYKPESPILCSQATKAMIEELIDRCEEVRVQYSQCLDMIPTGPACLRLHANWECAELRDDCIKNKETAEKRHGGFLLTPLDPQHIRCAEDTSACLKNASSL